MQNTTRGRREREKKEMRSLQGPGMAWINGIQI